MQCIDAWRVFLLFFFYLTTASYYRNISSLQDDDLSLYNDSGCTADSFVINIHTRSRFCTMLINDIIMGRLPLCPSALFIVIMLSLFVSGIQRSVCLPRADEQQVCVQTPTVASSPCLLTISMRCSRSTPWCDVLLKRLPSTAWTALVRSVDL